MARDVWQLQRPAVQTRLINKTITIPAFSAVCGRVNNSLYFESSSEGYLPFPSIVYVDFVTAITIEAWVKLNSTAPSIKNPIYYREITIGGSNPQYAFGIKNDKLYFDFRKGGVTNRALSSLSVSTGVWTHIAITWDGTTIKFYINGNLDSSTTALASPIDSYVDGIIYVGGSNGYAGFEATPSFFGGYLDEIRIWNFAKTQDQIITQMFAPRSYTESGLKFYTPFNEGVGIPNEKISGLPAATLPAGIMWSNIVYPQAYGASRQVILFPFSLDRKLSFKFPLIPPANNNHCMCISWFNDQGIFQRRKLYSANSSLGREDINPDPEIYKGEKISKDFTIEIWNIDGKATVDLAENLLIPISHTTQPQTALDHAKVNLATGILDASINENFPFTAFPIPFNATPVYS